MNDKYNNVENKESGSDDQTNHTTIKCFSGELLDLINKYSKENGSDTPDFILAEYLLDCLCTFDRIVYKREKWYGRDKFAISNTVPPETTTIGK